MLYTKRHPLPSAHDLFMAVLRQLGEPESLRGWYFDAEKLLREQCIG